MIIFRDLDIQEGEPRQSNKPVRDCQGLSGLIRSCWEDLAPLV